MALKSKLIAGGVIVVLLGAAFGIYKSQRQQIHSLRLEKDHAIEFAARETNRANGATKSLNLAISLNKMHQTKQTIPLAEYKAVINKLNAGIGRLDNAATHKPQLVEDGINDATFKLWNDFEQSTVPTDPR